MMQSTLSCIDCFQCVTKILNYLNILKFEWINKKIFFFGHKRKNIIVQSMLNIRHENPNYKKKVILKYYIIYFVISLNLTLFIIGLDFFLLNIWL